MPTAHLHNLHRFPSTLPTLPRATDFDRRVLVGYGEGFIVFAHDVGDGEVGTSVVLCGSEEGFEDVREEEGGGVRSGLTWDVVVL